jgi:hypothetical protein
MKILSLLLLLVSQVAFAAPNRITNAQIAANAAIAHSKMAAQTANRVCITDGSGFHSASSISTTVLGYIANLSSDAQTQLDGKQASLPLTTKGDILTRDASGYIRFPVCADGEVMQSDSGETSGWICAAAGGGGTGDVAGPASSVDSEIALFSGTSGKIIKRATGSGLVKITSGVASFGNVNLASEVTGDLPFANLTQVANNRFLGNNSGSTADAEELTPAEAQAIVGTVPQVLTQQSTPANPSAGSNKLYFKNDNKLYALDSSGTETEVAALGNPRDEVVVDGGNGLGSTNGYIRRLVNIRKNVGTAITYADSATLGASFTINSDGIYAISYSDSRTGGAMTVGISVNGSNLNAGLNSLDYTQGYRGSNVGTGGNTTAFMWTGFLEAGDVVRPHASDNTSLDTTTRIIFQITKVAN